MQTLVIKTHALVDIQLCSSSLTRIFPQRDVSTEVSHPTDEPTQLTERQSFSSIEERPVGLSEESSLPHGFRKELL